MRMSGGMLNRRGFVAGSLAGLTALSTGRVSGETMVAEGSRNPWIYHFRIGEADAWSISDANLRLGEGLDLMWPSEARPEMGRLLREEGQPLDSLPLYVNILVVRSGNEVMLFDAGFGGTGNERLGWLRDGLARIGILPDEVTAGFLSHAHADHLNGFVADGKPAFPNAAFHLLREEIDFWRTGNPDFSRSKRDRNALPGMIDEVRRNFDILSGQTEPVADGSELFGGLVRVEAAPGHTAGHACFRIRSGDDELFHLMDLAHHHLLMFADPGWTIAFDHEPLLAAKTREKFWTQLSRSHARCFGFHLPWPGLGRVVASGKGFRWATEPWSWA